MGVLDELLVGLGFEYDSKELDDFKSDIGDTVDSIKTLITISVAGAAAISGLTIASTASSDEFGKLANEIGTTAADIESLAFALSRAGGNADSMGNTLSNLSIKAAEASRGVGSGVEAFGLLGVSVLDANGKLKGTTDLMLEVSGAMRGLGHARQIELADKLGLRDSIRLLQQGPAAIRALTKEARELGVTNPEDALLAEQFQDSLVDIGLIIKQVGRLIARVFAPAAKELNNVFAEWFKTNRELIEQDLPLFIEQATSALKMLAVGAGIFIAMKLAGTVFTLIKMMRGLMVATLLTNAAVIMIPLALAAAAVAFVALVEDAKVFFEGGESFIGDMVKMYPEWEGAIVGVAAALATVAELTTSIFDGWAKIFDLDFSKFTEMLGSLPGFAADLLGFGDDYDPNIDTPDDRNAAEKSAQRIQETIAPVIAAATEVVAPVINNIAAQAAPVINNVVKQAAPIINNIAEKAKPAIGNITEAAKPVVVIIKDVAPVAEALAPVAQQFMQQADQGGPSIDRPLNGIGGDISTTTNTKTSTNTTHIEKMEFNIEDATSPVDTANTIGELFQQTQQDLNTTVDQ